MAKKAHACGEVTDKDVVVADKDGEACKIGSIVEIVPWGNDRYEGLYYIVAFEAGERGMRVLLAKTRWAKWDFKVNPARLSLRCFCPTRPKGE